MTPNADDDLIDTTTSEPVTEHTVNDAAPHAESDPTMAIVAALAQELQAVYANNHQALDSATRTLRAAVKHKH